MRSWRRQLGKYSPPLHTSWHLYWGDDTFLTKSLKAKAGFCRNEWPDFLRRIVSQIEFASKRDIRKDSVTFHSDVVVFLNVLAAGPWQPTVTANRKQKHINSRVYFEILMEIQQQFKQNWNSIPENSVNIFKIKKVGIFWCSVSNWGSGFFFFSRVWKSCIQTCNECHLWSTEGVRVFLDALRPLILLNSIYFDFLSHLVRRRCQS